MKVFVISSSENCIPLLWFLKQNNLSVVLFSDTSSKYSLESFESIKHCCNVLAIEHICSDKLYGSIEKGKPDVIFVMGYPHLIRLDEIDSSLKSKIFNIHFGLLPENKGPNPVFWQIKNGENELGMSIHRINEKFDDGAVVWKKSLSNEAHYSYGILEQIFSQITVEGVGTILQQLIQLGAVSGILTESKASHYFKRPELKDVLIDWNAMTTEEVSNLVKACNPWNKGATTFFNKMEVKLLEVEVLDNRKSNEKPGEIVSDKDELVLATKDGLLKIHTLNYNGTFVSGRFCSKVGFSKGLMFHQYL
jgi:methionyl-tRNA formyltransferase